MKTPALALFTLLVAAQLATLAVMIRGQERVLRHGEAFRFKTRPIDPADPFQGRYVALGFEADHIPAATGTYNGLHPRETIYALIDHDADGYARFSGWSRERPATGAYLKTRYTGIQHRWDPVATNHVHLGLRIHLPFDRFYMDEAKAPRAEAAAREATASTNCWADVRILNGRAAIADVYARGQSLRDLAAARP